MASSCNRVLTIDTINPAIIHLEYAVRGPIVQRACELEDEIAAGKSNFTEIIKCNIGDCHATGQKPITFYRQIMAGMSCPDVLTSFPSDVKDRVKRLLDCCPGDSVGSYSHSLGLSVVRKDVASFIEHRDGIPCDWNNVFLTCGATEAIKYVLSLISTGLLGNERAGVMIPFPQYPLYSATNVELGNYQIRYYLDEAKNWAFSMDELERAYKEASAHCKPRAIVVINPGNPTGQVLSRECMKEVVHFALKHRLVLLADEVYQMNVYKPDQYPWVSFKHVLHEMGEGFADRLEVASFMSASKGFSGECGFRGGYCELVNFDPDVQAHLYKALSARLCPPVLGQAMIGCCVNPPRPEEPSCQTFVFERDAILSDLRTKAELTSQILNSLPGITCNPVLGAMYAFPRIHLPTKAIKAAEEQNVQPDFFYCLRFLEEKGVCVIPGSGFGQVEGTYHFRTTILPSVEQIKHTLDALKDFHTKFMATYAD